MSKTRINENLVRQAPGSTTNLLKLLFEGLDWPHPKNLDIEDIPLLPWSPDELHLNPDEVARLTKIQQLPALTATQPFGVFILSFDGGRLPVGAVRRVVNQLVRKQRARRQTAKSLWNLNDLIFFCQSSNGVGTLHVVAFRDTKSVPVLKVISWDTNANQNRLELIATQNLPALLWPDGDSVDPDQWREKWSGAFTTGYREGIRSAAALASKMAEVAKSVRDEVQALYEVESEDGPLRELFEEVKKSLRSDLTPQSFADMYAQTMVYGLLTARITHPEDFAADALDSVLKFENSFLDAMYSSFRRKGDQAFDVDEFGLHDLAEILARTNMDQVLADFGTEDRKDDPVVFFYEEFLDQYDRDQKKELGTYYTPIPVVRFMVRAVDDLIKKEFELPLGVADQTTWGDYSKQHAIPIPDGLAAEDKVIRMIDPATGTGTFLLEWMRQAEANLKAAGEYSAEAMKAVVGQMDAFEISLSSYAVAHLKTSLELDPGIRSGTHIGIRLTDTLAGRAPDQLGLFGVDPIALEGQLADQVKFERKHSVVIGNPPYLRLSNSTLSAGVDDVMRGGTRGKGGQLLLDFLEPLSRDGLGVHAKNLYNLYVYFWRWAIWKACEQSQGPAVVVFITASSFLNGPGFSGMREWMRLQFDEVFVVDLGGDGRGSRKNENVFNGVQIAVSICIGFRRADRVRGQAQVRYSSIVGSRTEKLVSLSQLNLSSEGQNPWREVEPHFTASFLPANSGVFNEWPHLMDLFPWQHSGAQPKRQWIIGETKNLLSLRWGELSRMERLSRASAFRETRDRTVRGTYGALLSEGHLTPIWDISQKDHPEAVRRYGFRSFDRQWVLADGRLGDFMKRVLWQTIGNNQVFMVTLTVNPLGSGPAATASAHVPDMPFFRGSYGSKDVIPLLRTAEGQANVDEATLSLITRIQNRGDVGFGKVEASDLFAYCFGVLAGTDYTNRFHEELTYSNSCRMPLTRNRELFDVMVAYGEELLWLQTFGERFRSKKRKDLKVDDSINWVKMPSWIPKDSKDFTYLSMEESLRISDGELIGVNQKVWDFEVSGMQVLKKWLGYRTAKGAGKAAASDSVLDKIRPTEWEPEWSEELREIVHVLTETEKMRPAGIALLDRIMAGDLISADELPSPPEELRKPPRSSEGGDLLADEES